MPLAAGTRLGPYEIVEPIGKGGMGEVYRARDTRLGRDVAVKVSAEKFSERFEREARAIASLNHPNICQLYDVGDNYLVMELIDGPTLADRLKESAIPLDESLKIAQQITTALEAAHEKGIIHRDLKPGNIKITPQGVVKVLDFGLALVAPASAGDPDLVNSPTLTMRATQAGMILGTAAYMSPEQARGKPVDKRTDIWAFGVVFYEMLSGEPLFAQLNNQETVSDILAAVLRHEPDFTQVPASTRRLLKRCLEKDPAKRLRDIADAWALVEEEGESTTPLQSRLGMGSRLGSAGWALAVVATLALGALAFIHFREAQPETPVLRTTILPPPKTSFDFQLNHGPMAVSPDGRRLVFAATSSDGNSQLWVRPLDSLAAQPLFGTEGASFPFWSPDSRFVAFFAGGKLKKIDASGGPPHTLADVPNARGGSWSPEGVIVFAALNTGLPLQRVSAAGGVPATTVDPKGGSARSPWFLPDGRHFLYEQSLGGRIVLRVASLDSADDRELGEASSNAVYSQGHLLFLRQNTLMAQPFDLKRLILTAEAVPVAEQVQSIVSPGTIGCFSVSATGLLVYQAGGAVGGLRLTWFDRSGKPAGTLGDAAVFGNIEFSPDRRSLAARVVDQTGNSDIWIYDVARGFGTRFTFDPAAESNPVWSPDGRSIIFSSSRKGQGDLYRKASNGAGAEELLYADSLVKRPTSWSRDGKFLLYYAADPKTGLDLLMLPLAGDPKPVPFAPAAFNEQNGQFSWDGRWVAYQSNESGNNEIYAAPFPGPGGKRQISKAGGSFPRWRRDGKEIFYIGGDQRLTAAEVAVKGDALEVGVVRSLFGPIYTSATFYLYDISADGQRILMAVPPAQGSSEPLTLVQNWVSGLKK
jgi:serine/threonine protein kinase